MSKQRYLPLFLTLYLLFWLIGSTIVGTLFHFIPHQSVQIISIVLVAICGIILCELIPKPKFTIAYTILIIVLNIVLAFALAILVLFVLGSNVYPYSEDYVETPLMFELMLSPFVLSAAYILSLLISRYSEKHAESGNDTIKTTALICIALCIIYPIIIVNLFSASFAVAAAFGFFLFPILAIQYFYAYRFPSPKAIKQTFWGLGIIIAMTLLELIGTYDATPCIILLLLTIPHILLNYYSLFCFGESE